MAASNAIVADLLRRYAAALTLEGADRFKVKAYRRAAETLESLDEDVAQLIARGGDLQQLPGIGKAIAKKIEEILSSGTLPQLEAVQSKLAPELVELAARPALDPKKVVRIYKKLGISSLKELAERLESGAIGESFGSRIEFHVRQGLDQRPRSLLYDVEDIASRIESYLGKLDSVTRVSRAGSLRRKRDTVGDLNFVVSGKSAAAVFKQFAKFGGVQQTTKRGRNEALFQLSSGIGITMRFAGAEEWGLALLEQTGSAAHFDELTAAAKQRKIDLSVSGLKKKKLSAKEEENIYSALRLDFIEPELREERGEIQAAAANELPKLIRVEDLKGDLHMHTTASDGANSLAQMAAAAQERGYEYIAITDHSQSLKIANGLTEKRLLEQIKAIDKLNSKLKNLVILKSAEVDILEDGRLDYSNAVLKKLDLTICSIHSRFGLNREQQTERILRAMDNPYFNILGHATGRLLLKRQGYDLDLPRILKYAKANGCFVEINSSPDRLDLSDENALLAKTSGLKIAVNTDAHSIRELDFISAGINQARRGWLEPKDVLNTFPLQKLLKTLKR